MTPITLKQLLKEVLKTFAPVWDAEDVAVSCKVVEHVGGNPLQGGEVSLILLGMLSALTQADCRSISISARRKARSSETELSILANMSDMAKTSVLYEALSGIKSVAFVPASIRGAAQDDRLLLQVVVADRTA